MKNRKSSACRLFALVLTLGFLVMQTTIGMPQAVAADTSKRIAAPGQALANSDKFQEGGQQTAVSLEQAIKIAREAFQIPADFDKFTNGFNQSEQGAFWELNWNRSAKSGGNIDIRVNAQTGEIWSMSQWSPPLDGSSCQGLPSYSREQAKDIAAAMAEKLQPVRFKNTRLQPGRDYFPPLLSQPRGPVEYRYNFARLVNGFPFLENNINVTVNGDTGDVMGFYLNWDENGSFPDPSGSITKSQAEQMFRTQASPELYYFRPRIPGGSEVPIKLVYGLPGQKTQVLIDALTGDILDNNGNYYGLYDRSGGSDMKMANSIMEEYQLNPVEVSAVEGTKNLLPQDTALAKAKSAVSVPGEYTLRSSRLEQDYLFTEKKTWHFSWEAGDEPERKWLDISVDAANGELVSFHLNEYHIMWDKSKATEPKFSEADARKTAESFIEKVQPEKWGQVVFKDAQPVMGPFVREKQLPSAYTLVWSRVARDGIQFPDNGFTVDVDATSGKITGFQMNWYDVDFPDPQGVLDPDAAAGRFLQEAPLAEAYLRLWPGDQWKGSPGEAKIYLAYHLTNQNFNMLDAFSGQPLNFDGEVVIASPEESEFTDLAGNPAREAVEMLAGAGIVTAGGEFRPSEAVTQAELIAMLVRAGTYSGDGVRPLLAGGNETWYQPYYEKAAQLGILQKGEQPDPDAPVTRIFMARLSIHAMGLYRVAKLSDIYVLNFQDAAEIPEYLRGHAALSVGMGLLEPQEGNFRPQANVTRGEAAITLVKLMNSWK